MTDSHIATSQEKLDAVLGITGGKSVDDFLNDLSLDTTKMSEAVDEIKDQVTSSVQNIDKQISQVQRLPDMQVDSLEIKDIQQSLKKIEEMIDMSTKIMKHIAEAIMSTDLIDSELVSSAAAFAEELHINIKEFIDMYKSRLQFVDKIRVMTLKHQQDIEKMHLKQKFDLEKIEAQKNAKVNEVPEGTVEYRIEDITKLLDS